MREKKAESKYFELRRQASLNRMIAGELSFKLNEAIYKVLKKLEIKFPNLVEAYSTLN